MSSSQISNDNRLKTIILFCLWTIHGVFAFNNFQAVSDREISTLFQLMRGIFISWVLLCLILIVIVARHSLFLERLEIFIKSDGARDRLLLIFLLVFCLRIFSWFLEGFVVGSIRGYLQILKPALDLTGYVSLEISLLLIIANLRTLSARVYDLRRFFIPLVIILFVLSSVSLLISMTGLGILSGYKGDWQRGLPAVPLLEWQIMLACFVSALILTREGRGKLFQSRYLELGICLLIWLGTIAIWVSQPVVPGASALEPRLPNFEVYPFIDSQVYDEFAQSILAGQGFGADRIPIRPLYVIFLALLHWLVGQDYASMVFAQTIVFALFPVLLYILGRNFFGRSLGLSLAILAIFRDYISNFVSPYTGNLSYSKVYLSEIPTAMLLILFLILGFGWIRSGVHLLRPFLMGGVLGAAMLIRTQTVVALPIVILFAFLTRRLELKTFMRGMLLFFVSFSLMVGPWLWRNWNLTGEVIFDSPEYQTINLALRYSRLNGVEPQVTQLPGESSAEYNQRLIQIAKAAIAKDPLKAAWGVTNAFFNHCVNNILLFPLRIEIGSFGDFFIPSDAFWEKWEGHPTDHQIVLLAFYIFLFGLGVSVAWMRNGWLGLMPLALNLVYNLWTSLALLSGQRFMVSMDWSVYLYYIIGLIALICGLMFVLNRTREIVVNYWVQTNTLLEPMTSNDSVRTAHYVFLGIVFFAIGTSLPVSEIVIPDKYFSPSREVLKQRILDTTPVHTLVLPSSCFEKLVTQDLVDYTYGLALYPRYYGPGQGESFTDKVGYKPVEQGRLVFELIANRNSRRVIIPMNQPPEIFPHVSEVTLIHGEDGEVWFVFVQQGDAEGFYASEAFDKLSCGLK